MDTREVQAHMLGPSSQDEVEDMVAKGQRSDEDQRAVVIGTVAGPLVAAAERNHELVEGL